MRVVEPLGAPLKLVAVLDVKAPTLRLPLADWLVVACLWFVVLEDLCRPPVSAEIGDTRIVNDWLTLVVGRTVLLLLLKPLATPEVVLIAGASVLNLPPPAGVI